MRAKPERFSPKTAALPGSLHAEFVRCGKANCRCAQGALHGPYWRRHWMQDGRKRSAYVRLRDLEQTQTAIEQWRVQHRPVRSVLRELWALWRLLEEGAVE